MSARWYKRCGADFIHGTMMLSLEEKGAYSLCLDLIYDRGGPIPDDARWLSGVCGVSIRKWNSIRERLLSLGKLSSNQGHLTNARADFEIVSAEFQARERAESGAKGGRKRAENEAALKENKDIGQAELKPIEKIREDKKEEVQASPVAHAHPQAFPIDEAVQDWNDAAVAVGWPTVQRMSDTRRQAVRNRLRTDGIDGWRAAIGRARSSPYLGQSPPSWFTFDWFVKPGNFLKLIEGNYDRSHAANDRNGALGATARAAIAVFGAPG